MPKRSTNLNRARTHRTTASDLANLMDFLGMDAAEQRQFAEGVAAQLAPAEPVNAGIVLDDTGEPLPFEPERPQLAPVAPEQAQHADAIALACTLAAFDAELDANRQINWAAFDATLGQLWDLGYSYDESDAGYVLIAPDGVEVAL